MRTTVSERFPVAQSTEAKTVSTGVRPFDERIGGLISGRYYVLSGAPGSGKTSTALHFLGTGLDAHETCAVLTQDDPADLFTQAEYLGYDLQGAAAQDRLAFFRYRLDFQRHYSRVADPSVVFEELKSLLWDRIPHRLVIDSVLPLLEGGMAADEAVDAFAQFLDEIPCTTFITVPGDLSETYYRRIYNRISAGAAGIFHFENLDGAARQMTVRKLRQRLGSTESVRFSIRPGAGIVEELALRSHDDLPEETRRRVVLLSQGAKFPPEWLPPLRDAYELDAFDSVARAFGDLASANYGALLVALDPMRPEPALSLTRELRRAGNGAPILFVSSTRGLRGHTRAEGLRAGGDDFLEDTLGPSELLARIDNARSRGHRRLAEGAVAAGPPAEQATGDSGDFVPLEPGAFRSILRGHVDGARHAYFALVELGPADLSATEASRLLLERLRVRDGDLVAVMEDGRVALYLHDIHRKHVRALLTRLVSAEPGLADLDHTSLFSYPADREGVIGWLENGASARPGPVAGGS
ncbi:MAG TPA: ATPase domain-containing protein [Longimicrobiales bacterium]|nr:ATPase domain-containing protein [Longimicrobiales bacterium]